MNEEMLRVAEFLESSGYRFQSRPEDSIIHLGFRSDVAAYQLYFEAQKDFMLKVSATPSLVVPVGARVDMAVAVARANMGLNCGFFEINMDSGDVWYRFLIPLKDGFPSNDLLQLSIDATRLLIDRYLPAFLSVVYGNEPAKDAVALVENAVKCSAECFAMRAKLGWEFAVALRDGKLTCFVRNKRAEINGRHRKVGWASGHAN